MKPKVLALLIGFVIILLVSASFRTAPSPLFSNRMPVPLETALAEGWVNADFLSNGGHKGNCISGNITNLTDTKMKIAIEPGRRLVSFDEGKQDILVVKQQAFFVDRGTEKEVDVFGFCCQASNSSPRAADQYEAGHMTNGSLLSLAQYLSTNQYPVGAMQKAVWALSDDKSVASIHHANKDSIRGLLQYVADLKGVEVPWYTMEYTEDIHPDSLFSGRPKSIMASINCTNLESQKVHVVLYNKYGVSVKRAWIIIPPSPTSNEQEVAIDVEDLPRDKYYLKAFVPGRKLHDKTINI